MKDILYIINKSKVSFMLLIVCILMAILSSFFAVVPAQFIGFAISSIGEDGGNLLIGKLIKNHLPFLVYNKYSFAFLGIGLFFLFSFISIIFRNFFCYYATIVANKIIISIRQQLFSKILRLDFFKYLEKQKGDIIFTTMNDTQRLEYIFSDPFYTLFSDLFDLVWITVFLLLIDPILIFLLIIIIPLLYLASIKTAKLQKQVTGEIQKIDSSLTTKIEQTLLGFETIKAFNGEAYEDNIFSNKTREAYKYQKKAAQSLSFFFPVEGLLRVAGTCILLTYSIYRINTGYMLIGMLAVLFQYANQFYNPIRNISRYYQTLQAGIVSARRIINIFNLPDERDKQYIDYNNTIQKDKKIIFNHVSLTINNVNILTDFSFDCAKGDFILIKGYSGCGKTSLLRMLLGFYPVDNGFIAIDGKDINSFSKHEIRNKIAYVGQDVFLHNDSILNNVIYPLEKYEENQSHIIDIIGYLNLNNKDLNVNVGEQGQNLSGGEKRRVAIARAVFKDSDIMVLDEITAGLDKENEDLVLNALEKFKRKKTIILVSHSNNKKLFEIADKVISLDGGNKID